MKTPEQMAAEFSKFEATYGVGSELLSYRQGLYEGFLAGYQAAKVETNLPTSAKWISVKEQMPAANICVLIAQDKTIWVSGYCDTLKTWGWYENGETCRPTHWMPLPEPPKEGK